tara:strand:+ start:1261 stop:1782 length:522 start_codon:yes stop_codon:yes gene_type:complete
MAGLYDKFSAPVPGESLTHEPGKQAWEQPPRYAAFEEALDETMKKVFQSKNVAKVITMLDAGVDVESIARTIVFSGFMEGQYTPDVGMLMSKNVYEAILTIGVLGEVENLKLENKPSQANDISFEEEMANLKFANNRKNMTSEDLQKLSKKSKQKVEQSVGLMARPEENEEII